MTQFLFDGGVIERSALDSDENGFTLILFGEDGDTRHRIRSTQEARDLMGTLAPLVDWFNEEDRARQEYLRRDRIPGDTYSVRWDRLAQAADWSRKALRESA